MKLIDAHVHLSDAEYTGHIDELIADAKNAGVVALMTNSMDLKTCQNDLNWQRNTDLVYPALGIHPWNVNVLKKTNLKNHRFNPKTKNIVKAIGEIGLDYKYETVWEKQMVVFDKMLHLAESLELSGIIHSRGTTDKVVDMLPSTLKRVLLHWFSYPMTALIRAIDNGYFITEGPPATYSTASEKS